MVFGRKPRQTPEPESRRPEQVQRMLAAIREEECEYELFPGDDRPASKWARARMEAVSRNSSDAERRAAWTIAGKVSGTSPSVPPVAAGPLPMDSAQAHMAALIAVGEEIAAELAALGGMLAQAHAEIGELVGMVAPVAEQAAQIVGTSLAPVDTALGGLREAEQGLRAYLTGLHEY